MKYLGLILAGLVIVTLVLGIVVGIYAGFGWLLAALLNFVLPAFGVQAQLTLWHGIAILLLISIFSAWFGHRSHVRSR